MMLPSRVGFLQLRRTSCTRPSAGRAFSSRLVLGIETSCDDTGAAVLDEKGAILGESLHSQTEVHLRGVQAWSSRATVLLVFQPSVPFLLLITWIRTGGIVPTAAQRLHRANIERVVREALERSGVEPGQLSAVATTVKPGLALSLGIGLEFSQRLVRKHNKPFIPIHHMEAHALTVRMLHPVAFPFLVLLISGGHSLLAVARGVDDFLLLGHGLDEAPGDTLDKVARRLSLTKHPQCCKLSGGQAIELLSKGGDRTKFPFKTPMGQTLDCCFSFAGLRNQVTMTIMKKEAEEGVAPGTLLSCVNDIAAATQHTVAAHLAKRTHRALLFCEANGLLPSSSPTLVLSGGVASNEYIQKALSVVTEMTGVRLLCPPAKFCTDNGVMVAWNGVERLREGKGILSPDVHVCYEPKAPLGVDMTAEVKAAAIRLPSVRMKIS